MDGYLKISDWRVKENSTVTYSVDGLTLSNSGAITANYWLSEIYDEEIADAHRNADLHLHDLSMLTGYCAGRSLKQLIKEGLGEIRHTLFFQLHQFGYGTVRCAQYVLPSAA